MFFLVPLIFSFGFVYLIGEFLFERRSYRWFFIIGTFLFAWIFIGLAIWNRTGLSYFMNMNDSIGNPVDWFDGNLDKWLAWISIVVGSSFLVSILTFTAFILPFSHKKWWQFWKK